MSSLNRIKWSELSHAYGFASNIEPLLETFYSFPPESDSKSEPWHTLWRSLCHPTPIIVDALSTAPAKATQGYFLLPVCIELARVNHCAEVPEDLEKPYFAALAKFPELVASASLRDQGSTAAALAAVAVSKGQWDTAHLLVEIESKDVPAVLTWYHAR